MRLIKMRTEYKTDSDSEKEDVMKGRNRRNREKQKNQGRRRAAALGLLLSAALCTGCGSGSKTDSAMPEIYQNSMAGSPRAAEGSWGADYSGGSYELNEVEPAGDSSFAESAAYEGQKLIRNVDLTVETKEFDTLMPALNTQIKQLGGYIENMETYNGSQYSSGGRGSRYARLTVRIPKARTDGFLQAVSDVCNVVRKNENVDDVTLSYADMESRRNTLRTEQERLLSFLEQAQSIEEIITIENRLSDVRYQLESMESRLRVIDNQVEYSTVNLDISEVKELTPATQQTVWERIESGLAENLNDIGEGLVDFGVWIVINIPYFVIWVIVITAAVLVVKGLFKRRHRSADKKNKEKE